MLTFGHSPCKRPPSQKRWSDSSLQVKVSGILLCFYMIGADATRSQTIIVTLQCMHQAPSD